MAIKKSELYSSLWSSCDELRGGMDASQYKDYVLSLLFIKYISDKYAGVPYAPISIPEGAGFGDMVALGIMPFPTNTIDQMQLFLEKSFNPRFGTAVSLIKGGQVCCTIAKLCQCHGGANFC